MGKGINKVIIVGNCGTDPEVRYMPNGGAVANISVATSESWKDKNTGQMVDKTEWHKLCFYGNLAEIVGKYVTKGSKIYAEGKLQTKSWEKDGVKRYSTEIVCNEMQMLDSKGDNQGGQQQQQQAPQQQQQRQQQQAPQQQPARQQQQGQVYPNQIQQQQYQMKQDQKQHPQYQEHPNPQVDDFYDDIPF